MKTAFHRQNQQQLAEVLKGGIIVLTAYMAMQRSNDSAFGFEQEANFWWLSGVDYPEWWIIIDGLRHKSWLVAPHISVSHQIFDGSMTEDEALEASGADGVLNYDEALSMLRDLAKRHSVVYTLGDHPHAEHYDFMLNPAPKKLHDLLVRTFTTVQDCRQELARLRAIKQPDEIKAIKQAINLTADGFEKVKALLPNLSYEHEVEAEFTHHFRSHGAKGHAYDPIVAAGQNACTLHYMANQSKFKKPQLLLMDVGARVSGYAADITRTYAIGEPTKRQRAVHQAVEEAHVAIIKLLRPGLSVQVYNQEVDTIMKQALRQLNLMDHADDDKSYRYYFPHAISHGLGVDVHDSLGSPSEFAPGMILTVEPGIYIPEEGIGVRVEDDILITAKGHTNLSARLSTGL
jgi:Xaa-Pro aminopeptidase